MDWLKKTFLQFIFILPLSITGADDKLLKPMAIAPTFSLPDLQGNRVSLRVYCGDTLLKPHVNSVRQTVILSFWATYCVPCQKEIPQLIQLAQYHKNDSLKIFLISIDKEGSDIVLPFVKEKQYSLPVLLDPYRKTAERYGVVSVPSLFVIDPYGRIQYSTAGFPDEMALDKKLNEILKNIWDGNALGKPHSSSSAVNGTGSLTSINIPVNQRWEAVFKIECGNSLLEVAKTLNVTPEEISSWHSELKNAAFLLWGADSTHN